MSAALDALGSPVRRQILRLLAEEPRSVVELTASLDAEISRPAVSKHLRLLEGAKLLTHEARGRKNIYKLEARGFEEARAELDAFWNEALQRFRLLAENTPELEDRT